MVMGRGLLFILQQRDVLQPAHRTRTTRETSQWHLFHIHIDIAHFFVVSPRCLVEWKVSDSTTQYLCVMMSEDGAEAFVGTERGSRPTCHVKSDPRHNRTLSELSENIVSLHHFPRTPTLSPQPCTTPSTEPDSKLNTSPSSCVTDDHTSKQRGRAPREQAGTLEIPCVLSLRDSTSASLVACSAPCSAGELTARPNKENQDREAFLELALRALPPDLPDSSQLLELESKVQPTSDQRKRPVRSRGSVCRSGSQKKKVREEWAKAAQQFVDQVSSLELPYSLSKKPQGLKPAPIHERISRRCNYLVESAARLLAEPRAQQPEGKQHEKKTSAQQPMNTRPKRRGPDIISRGCSQMRKSAARLRDMSPARLLEPAARVHPEGKQRERKARAQQQADARSIAKAQIESALAEAGKWATARTVARSASCQAASQLATALEPLTQAPPAWVQFWAGQFDTDGLERTDINLDTYLNRERIPTNASSHPVYVASREAKRVALKVFTVTMKEKQKFLKEARLLKRLALTHTLPGEGCNFGLMCIAIRIMNFINFLLVFIGLLLQFAWFLLCSVNLTFWDPKIDQVYLEMPWYARATWPPGSSKPRKNRDIEYYILSSHCKSKEEIRIIFRQLLMGLHHIHANDVVHCDIKPYTLLLLPAAAMTRASKTSSWMKVQRCISRSVSLRSSP
eukprot:g71466.t1